MPVLEVPSPLEPSLPAPVLDSLRMDGVSVRSLFLNATTGSLVKRFSETRRPHPLRDVSGDEKARGVAQLKDLALGARLAAAIETHDDWKAQPAQIEVGRSALVAEVRAMLARARG